ncbi:hypothetical protein Tco_1575928 [Tanacetum coccineum]
MPPVFVLWESLVEERAGSSIFRIIGKVTALAGYPIIHRKKMFPLYLITSSQRKYDGISLRICGTVVELLPMTRGAPKCEKIVKAFLCQNLNVKSATLPYATFSGGASLNEAGPVSSRTNERLSTKGSKAALAHSFEVQPELDLLRIKKGGSQ